MAALPRKSTCIAMLSSVLSLMLASLSCYIVGQFPAFFSFLVPCLIVVVCNSVLFFFVSREIRSTLAAAPKTDNKTFSKEFKVYLSIFFSIGLTWFFAFLVLLVPNRNAQNVRLDEI